MLGFCLLGNCVLGNNYMTLCSPGGMSLQKGYRSSNPPREHSFKNLPSPPGHISNTEPTSFDPSSENNAASVPISDSKRSDPSLDSNTLPIRVRTVTEFPQRIVRNIAGQI